MYKIAKEFSFAMAHRLSHHPGLCKNLHGHNYKVIVGLKSPTLDDCGMVMDFADLKAIVQHYIKDLDHALMVNDVDEEYIKGLKEIMPFLKVIEVPYDPTAENMCKHMFQHIQKEIAKYINNVQVDYVTIYETDTSFATYCEE
jgi:6-pyruvoyltetrahydropterin/6-carboxytetrahydropterin synthase